jgi:hypothetical protein
MQAYLLDSGILVRHLRKRTGYAEPIRHLNQAGDLYISALTRVDSCLTDWRYHLGRTKGSDRSLSAARRRRVGHH